MHAFPAKFRVFGMSAPVWQGVHSTHAVNMLGGCDSHSLCSLLTSPNAPPGPSPQHCRGCTAGSAGRCCLAHPGRAPAGRRQQQQCESKVQGFGSHQGFEHTTFAVCNDMGIFLLKWGGGLPLRMLPLCCGSLFTKLIISRQSYQLTKAEMMVLPWEVCSQRTRADVTRW